MSRFDYIAYDATATRDQGDFKLLCIGLEAATDRCVQSQRWREAALMKLEEFYMCIGKGIRDDQIARNGAAELQEGRSDG